MKVITPSLTDSERIKSLLEYRDVEPIPLCDNIEMMFEKDSERLRKNKKFELITADNLLETFEYAIKCKQKDFSDLNVIYNEKEDKISILDDTNDWIECMSSEGIRVIIQNLQDGFLNNYEQYLITHIENTSLQIQQKHKEHLKTYYYFLACFDVLPLCSSENQKPFSDYSDFLTHERIDTYFPLYTSIKSKLKYSEKNKVKKDYLKALNNSSDKDMHNFYKTFYELFYSDDEFAEFIKNKDPKCSIPSIQAF